MPADYQDPLLYNIEGDEELLDYEAIGEHRPRGTDAAAENVPLLSSEATPTSSTSSFVYPPPSHPPPTLRTARTPPGSSGASELDYHPRPQPKEKDTTRLPPRTPILSLSIHHILHRLTSPAPVFPERAALTSEDDALAGGLGGLPLPNTTAPVRLARQLTLLYRDRMGEPRGVQRARENGRGRRGSGGAVTVGRVGDAGSGARGGRSGETDEGGGRPEREEGPRRIPGAIDDEDSD